jgi:2-amino-4-hydroxy-6-hydroxymethyldihydropteridine diphosphokinase
MALVYLGLGTNLGDKNANLNDAIKSVSDSVGTIISISSFIETKSWGFDSENLFLNAVISVASDLLPLEILKITQQIEINLGRTKKTTDSYADRIIDIDILFYDDLIVDLIELKIPHPLITERDFVLLPLIEIAPNLVHPVSGLCIADYFKTEL